MSRALSYLALSVLVSALFIVMVWRSSGDKGVAQDARQATSLEDTCGVEKEVDAMDAPQEFERYHREIRTRDGETGPSYPINYKMIEVNKAREAKATSFFKYNGLPWVERGPGNVGGRTRGLIVDPDDPIKNTWFAGSVGGGIWKTTNAGTTWVNKTPTIPNLATVTIAMAASNHAIIYAGTGEGFFNGDAVRGDGIWKSTDRGETWIQLSSTAGNTDFSYVNRVIVDPSNENIVLAATNAAILRSTSGGSSWNRVHSGGGRIQQIVENPLNFNVLYATRNSNGVLKSTDRGLTWTSIVSGIRTGARCELAVSRADTARLFLAMEAPSSVSDLYVSDDGGGVWARATQSSGTPPNWLKTQGWYDNTIAAHPYDRDICFVGGVDMYKIQITGAVTQAAGVLSVAQTNTSGFLTFVNSTLPFGGGGIGSGKDFYGTTTAPLNLVDSDYVSVEIRFGPGVSQKAHRFKNGANFQYQYLDYISVPFQVWDVVNNRQLMASFRDSDTSGVFKLVTYDAINDQREYIFVHAVSYDPNGPNANIATVGGERYKNIDAIWPSLVSGQVWSPTLPPASTLRINNGLVPGRVRTTTQMTNWTQSQSSTYVHADHHNIAIIPVDQATQSFRIVHGSDGGIATSTNGGVTWSTPNLGYNTSQFYGVDKRPGTSQYFGGTQDNGSLLSTINPAATSIWSNPIGGDGFASIWHYKDPSKLIGSLYYNQIEKSINGGGSFQSATTDLSDIGSVLGPFITPIAKSNIDPDLLFVIGSLGIWRSDNFGDNWTLFRVAAANWGFGSGSNAAISQADPQIVWAGYMMLNGGTTRNIFVSTDGGVSFSPTNNYIASLGRLSGLATHPSQPRTAYALFSISRYPKILRTTDLGQSWQDISGFASGTTTVSTNGFPDVATYCLLVMPHNPNEIWAGTEIGLFISTNNGVSWTYANDVLPAVSIWQMRAVDDEIVVATHGRGIWTVKIPALLTAPPPVMTLSPRLNKSTQRSDGVLSVNISLRSPYDSTQVLLKGLNIATLAANALAKDTLVPFQVVKAESLTMSVTSYKNGRPYLSVQRGMNVGAPKPVSVQEGKSTLPTAFSLSQNYPNPFNPSTIIRYGVPVESKVTLVIFDMLGRKVQTLVDGQLKAGVYTETWNASALASGVYYYRIDARDVTPGSGRRFSETKRLILMK
ncbi:MAG: T9SS type A sorting domain-containing protein [Ignavibacteriales bacterium]|nr:T9SS type A sorting domain-containing protein [Ignavibacteriales bacterium]